MNFFQGISACFPVAAEISPLDLFILTTFFQQQQHITHFACGKAVQTSNFYLKFLLKMPVHLTNATNCFVILPVKRAFIQRRPFPEKVSSRIPLLILCHSAKKVHRL
ncbi:hypothetical protein [Zongyangia hominis]|uniref:Uncharacterized protein n=1 Tax=Zongyangia hominis TaxID=2763677 RepID=A0A926IBI1_9FIRM|nr:hypothetical protein [Zongyangia hominis]MBC8570120.1 hypothetical protein [Zongyangia hominis]